MSTFSHAVHPLFEAMAWLLAVFFGVIPNYAFAIAMLTVVVMVLLSPLTLKSTRSMLAMQRLAPEMKKLQQRYKGDRQRLNEEMMALYKQHGASPAGGCLPMLLQMPAFIILYDTIRGLTNTVGPHHIPEPRYISHSTLLYQHLMAGHGTMMSFGIDLAKSATSVHGGLLTVLPFYLLVVGSIGLQFLQMRQLTNRNPQAAAANPQMQSIQKFMPLIFGFIYISIAAGVNIYFLVSSFLRILQQELMYRYDPTLRAAVAQGPQVSSVGKPAIEAKASPHDPTAGDLGGAGPPAPTVGRTGGGFLASLLGGGSGTKPLVADSPGTPPVGSSPPDPSPGPPSSEPAVAGGTPSVGSPGLARGLLGNLLGHRGQGEQVEGAGTPPPGDSGIAKSVKAQGSGASGVSANHNLGAGASNGKASNGKASNGKASNGKASNEQPGTGGNPAEASAGRGKSHSRSQSKRARRPR